MLDTPPQSWDDVWALTPNHDYSWVQSAPLAWQPEDTPSGPLRVELITYNAPGVSVSKSAMLAYTDGATNLTRYFGEIINTEFAPGRWAKISTATPPQEFDLPLVDGFVHYDPGTKSTYSKSQEGLVVVHFYCKKADGTDIVQNDTIAMLPEGFHPSANVHIPANVSFDGSSVYSQDVATAVADPTGRVWIAYPPAGCKAVTTTLVFYAAS